MVNPGELVRGSVNKLAVAAFGGAVLAGSFAADAKPAASEDSLPAFAEHYNFSATAYCKDTVIGFEYDENKTPIIAKAGTVIARDSRGGNQDMNGTYVTGYINGYEIKPSAHTYVENGSQFSIEFNSGNTPTLSPDKPITAHLVGDHHADPLHVNVGCEPGDKVEPVEPVDPVDPVDPPVAAEKQGYRMVAADGGEFTFGDTKFFGSNVSRNNPEIPIVGIADSETGSIQVDARGNVFAKGDAVFHGSVPPEQLPTDDSVVGIALNKDGSYRLATAQGRVFGFGGANADVLEASGDTDPAFKYNQPIVGIVASPDGNGYWLVAEDGGVFANGDAGFYGSTGGIKLNKRVVGMGVTPSGNGYWLVAEDGGVFAFGDAPFLGSTGSIRLNQPVVGIQSSSTSTPKNSSTGVNHNFGYRMVAKDGGVFSYGNAHFLGSLGGIPLEKEVVAVAA